MSETSDADPPLQYRAIYDVGPQLRKVRLMMIFSLLCFAGAVFGGYVAFYTLGRNPADGFGGQLAPLAHRLGAAVGIIALGAAFFIGMFIFGRFYVAQIFVSEDEQTLRFRLVGPFSHPRLDISVKEVIGWTFREGHYDAGINNPWTAVRIRSRRWPLIVDAQGEVLDSSAYDRFIVPRGRQGRR